MNKPKKNMGKDGQYHHLKHKRQSGTSYPTIWSWLHHLVWLLCALQNILKTLPESFNRIKAVMPFNTGIPHILPFLRLL